MRKKTVLALVLVLVAAALAVTGAVAFRAQPIVIPGDTYIIPDCAVWTEPPNAAFDGCVYFKADEAQTQAVLAALAGHEKRLSTERLIDGLRARYLSRPTAAQVPDWVEADFTLVDTDTDRDGMSFVLFGNGHVQIRSSRAYIPPYYEVEDGAEEQCEALMAPLQIEHTHSRP